MVEEILMYRTSDGVLYEHSTEAYDHEIKQFDFAAVPVRFFGIDQKLIEPGAQVDPDGVEYIHILENDREEEIIDAIDLWVNCYNETDNMDVHSTYLSEPCDNGWFKQCGVYYWEHGKGWLSADEEISRLANEIKKVSDFSNSIMAITEEAEQRGIF